MVQIKDIYEKNKLLKHLDRLAIWDKEGFTYPILIDLDITDICNNKCPQCFGILNRTPITLSFEKIKEIISQLVEMKAKAITFAGWSGDPACHPNLAEIIRFAKQKGLDVAMFTNGLGLNDEIIEAIIDCCTWVRISLDADGPEIYQKTHGMPAEAFNKVIENVTKLVKKRKEKNSDIVVGFGYLTGPYSIPGIFNAAKLAKEIGVDYIRFRPFFMYDLAMKGQKKFIEKEKQDMMDQLEKAKTLEDENFSVSHNEKRCDSVLQERKRNFKVCYVPHLVVSITTDLKVYPCCPFKNNEKYLLGDLNKQTFKEIWLSEKRKNVQNIIDIKECPNPCQFENHAEFLWAIKQSVMHENFL